MPVARRIAVVCALLAAGGAAIAGGWASRDSVQRAPRGVGVAAASTSTGAVVTVRGSRYGRVLFDGRGRALYLFTRDRPRTSRCFGDCARAWPPFLTSARPRARGDARASLLGSIRRGRRRQVTYDGHPLYYYVGDREPGVILCQAVREFGGLWYVVAPNGDAVRR